MTLWSKKGMMFMWKTLDHESPSQEEVGYFEFFDKDVIGQMRAKEKLAKKFAAWRHQLRDKEKPSSVLCFLGPSGVGKTFLVRIFAKLLLGNPDAFVRIDCSTYQEKHSISRLIGSPPGYVGFDGEPELSQEKLDFWGNRLLESQKQIEDKTMSEEEKLREITRIVTIKSQIESLHKRHEEIIFEILLIEEELKRNTFMTDIQKKRNTSQIKGLVEEGESILKKIKNLEGQIKKPENQTKVLPPSILLFDEIEKMHPEITRALLPMFDSGIVPLANGERINFRNCFVFMTSNIGSAKMAQALSGKNGPIGFEISTNEDQTQKKAEKSMYDLVIQEVNNSNHFPTELIGRIGKENFVVFHPLKDEEMRKIVDDQLGYVSKRFKEVLKDVQIEFTNKLREYILEETADPMNRSLGARPIENIISAKITPALVNLVIKEKDGGIIAGDKVKVDIRIKIDKKGKKKKKIVVKKFEIKKTKEKEDEDLKPLLLPAPKQEDDGDKDYPFPIN